MKIVFTGGGTGGHFYPIIAVAQSIRQIVAEQKLVPPKLYYLGPDPYESRALFDNGIEWVHIPAGKMRRYFSLLNFLDYFKIAWGMIVALGKVFMIYPDVVFSKGGYAAFPTVFAARLLRIPIIIHESDSKPSRVNQWSGKFAYRIGIAYESAAAYFPAEKTALIGNPMRQELLVPVPQGAREFLKLDANIPVIFIVGGSLGAQRINDVVVDWSPQLLTDYQIIHQVGKNNLKEVEKRLSIILLGGGQNPHYKLFDFLNESALRMAAGAADLIISRAGAGLIFEIAQWGKPSIIIPIPEEVAHDQRTNAFTYARSGAAVVIEEVNLTPSVLLAEIKRLIANPGLRAEMGEAAKKFARPDAAPLLAQELLTVGLSHGS